MKGYAATWRRHTSEVCRYHWYAAKYSAFPTLFRLNAALSPREGIIASVSRKASVSQMMQDGILRKHHSPFYHMKGLNASSVGGAHLAA